MYSIRVSGTIQDIERFVIEAVTLQGNDAAKPIHIEGYQVVRECSSHSRLFLRNSGRIEIVQMPQATIHDSVFESLTLGIDSRFPITLKQLKKLAERYDVNMSVFIAGKERTLNERI